MNQSILENLMKHKVFDEGPHALFVALENHLLDAIESIHTIRKDLQKFYCEEHEEWKQRLHSDSDLDCESCFEAYYHANEFEGVAQEDREVENE